MQPGLNHLFMQGGNQVAHGNNTTHAQTFEGMEEEEDTCDGAGVNIAQSRVDKEQLEFAKALISQQKGEMLALIKKMREMHSELKVLKTDHPQRHFAEASCQTASDDN